jgi:GTP cyclohydrolase FolE2
MQIEEKRKWTLGSQDGGNRNMTIFPVYIPTPSDQKGINLSRFFFQDDF